MILKEHFYTAEFFQSSGISPFREHVKEYLCGQRTVPVSRTTSHNSHDIFFTFSDPLLWHFLKHPDLMKKPYGVALKYGFRGYSTGKKNGIFFVEKKNSRLIETIDRLVVAHEDTIREDLNLQENGLDTLRDVKIVWHEPSRKRMAGVYNTRNDRMLFLDFARY